METSDLILKLQDIEQCIRDSCEKKSQKIKSNFDKIVASIPKEILNQPVERFTDDMMMIMAMNDDKNNDDDVIVMGEKRPKKKSKYDFGKRASSGHGKISKLGAGLKANSKAKSSPSTQHEITARIQFTLDNGAKVSVRLSDIHSLDTELVHESCRSNLKEIQKFYKTRKNS